jgi:tellurite resistance protein TehA-like permease
MGIKGYSAKSLPARLYKWFWFEKRMPDGLCPYAWKSLFMYLVLIPYVIVCLPVVLIDLFSKEQNGMADNHGSRFFASVVMYIGLFVVASLLYSPTLFWFMNEKESFFGILQFTGAVFWVIGAFVGFIFLIMVSYKAIQSKILDMRFPYNIGEKKPSLVVEFVKAKYNKYCPKIDWEDQD